MQNNQQDYGRGPTNVPGQSSSPPVQPTANVPVPQPISNFDVPQVAGFNAEQPNTAQPVALETRNNHRMLFVIIAVVIVAVLAAGVAAWALLKDTGFEDAAVADTAENTTEVTTFATSLSSLSLQSILEPGNSTISGWTVKDESSDTALITYTSPDSSTRIIVANGTVTHDACTNDQECTELHIGSYYRVIKSSDGVSEVSDSPNMDTVEISTIDANKVLFGTYDFSYKRDDKNYKMRVLLRATPVVYVSASYGALDSSTWNEGADAFLDTITLNASGN